MASLAGYFRSLPLPSERLAQARALIVQEHWQDLHLQKPFHVSADCLAGVRRLTPRFRRKLRRRLPPNRESSPKKFTIHSSKARHDAYTCEPRHDVNSKSGDLPHESNNRDPADRIGALRNLFRSSEDHHARPYRGEDPGGCDRCRRQRPHAAVPCERMRAEQVKTEDSRLV